MVIHWVRFPSCSDSTRLRFERTGVIALRAHTPATSFGRVEPGFSLTVVPMTQLVVLLLAVVAATALLVASRLRTVTAFEYGATCCPRPFPSRVDAIVETVQVERMLEPLR